MSTQAKGRAGGILPINAVASKKTNPAAKSTPKTPAPKLRLIIRRLPPGLSESEFWEALGSDWQSGNGKVDWHAFKEGKISRDPSKPSRPGRAYVKVKEQALLETLSTIVKTASFKDAKNTSGDSCLIGPPSLEFAPYSKTPSGRNRHDGRQGTIDQDQEFIDFLQSLTEPISKPAINGPDGTEAKAEKTTTTPLVQFIKEKKANKAKEKEAAAAAKNTKKNHESKEAKSKAESRPTVVVKSNTSAADRTKIAKATQEVVKAANKAVAQIPSKTPTVKSEGKATKEASSSTISTPAPASTPAAKPERQRGSASAASKMIARDLGLVPKEPRAPRTARNASTAASATIDNVTKPDSQQKVVSPNPGTNTKANNAVTAPASAATSASTPASASATASVSTPPTGPKKDRTGQTQQAKGTQQATQRSNKQTPPPTSGAKSAFLKHANPSQGITEDLLRSTFSGFGEVTRCEIDKKKGLGYVDFADTEALRKAMASSPVKVGNGSVVVLENRSPYHKNKSQSGGSAQQQTGPASPSKNTVLPVPPSTSTSSVNSPQPPPAVVATAEPTPAVASSPQTSVAAIVEAGVNKAIQSSSSTTTTAAPKGGRAGNTTARGARGNTASSSNRGSSNQNQGRGRGNSRSRGGRGGRQGGNAGAATSGSAAPVSAAPVDPNTAVTEPSKPPPAAEKQQASRAD